ncbi:hypothetical protein COCNU_16G000330 [Cocos nucifera]|uniref:Uncharacterized protein n=1 Tax=Cocos nucifera TaxID=13894 RepID=A0A8K0NEL7_COCNU|nr:hypothetical protein COCNU_16G000330 [Cocos nucifera]
MGGLERPKKRATSPSTDQVPDAVDPTLSAIAIVVNHYPQPSAESPASTSPIAIFFPTDVVVSAPDYRKCLHPNSYHCIFFLPPITDDYSPF